ncbi:MAG: hypothetical protein HDR05_14655 [Lachnospiraceae bacterium]|nr:hypothetical protein [Lachnospiraceae bacterium]
MNRLGIFVFYDKEGKADAYVYHLLDSMAGIVDKIIIVVNGIVRSDFLKKFNTYTENVVIRKNVGYDAGAYKEIILGLAENNELANWDEIVLLNDTFYGPFFDWQVIFEEMEVRDVDFWGLSKWVKGKAKWYGGDLPEHVQGYFLVIRKRMLVSSAFVEFWRTLDNLSTYHDVICRFEVMFTVYHSKQGFKYASWLDNDDIYTKTGETVYCVHPYDLIRSCRFPVLKRKAITITNFVQAGAALHYIENHFEYSTKMIWDHIERIEKETSSAPFSFCEIKQFVNTHKKIYIYGYGKWGHAMESLFVYKGWEVSGFIDSNVTKQNQYVRKLEDVQMSCDDGLVVALGKKSFLEVYPQLKGIFEENQLLLPNIM